jgi:hypothetical protein
MNGLCANPGREHHGAIGDGPRVDGHDPISRNVKCLRDRVAERESVNGPTRAGIISKPLGLCCAQAYTFACWHGPVIGTVAFVCAGAVWMKIVVGHDTHSTTGRWAA